MNKSRSKLWTSLIAKPHTEGLIRILPYNCYLIIPTNSPVVSYGCETWSLTLREEHRLRVFKNRVLRRIFGSKRDGVTGSGEDYITRNLMICTNHQILFG
jgi:hypothetical protein